MYNMSEQMLKSVYDLQPGDRVDFDNFTQIKAFEDMVATVIEPLPSVQEKLIWDHRPPINTLIRPPKFNGTIANIALEVMQDPYQKLLSAANDGWKLPGPRYIRNAENINVQEKYYKGFYLTANAQSTGRGTIGEIITALWYIPAPFKKRDDNKKLRKSSDDYGAVRRIVSVPKIEADHFSALNEKSRKIAYEVLRREMSNPILNPFRN